MAIADQIKLDIPKKIKQFSKLTRGLPYHYAAWKPDRNGVDCLYYRFKGSSGKKQHTKKVPIKEMAAAVMRFQQTGVFSRQDYRKLCPEAQKSGPCGFAVVGGYIGFRHKARYQGVGKGFAL